MSSISIIIPAYNVENYILDSIESVLTQTMLPDEIVIINDGSTDNTAKILQTYETNPLIKVFHTANNGLGEARNRGLKESSSEYIYFFDSDDLLDNNFIEDIKKNIFFYNHPEIILFSGRSFHDDQHKGKTDFFPSYDREFQDYFKNSYSLISKLMNQGSFFSSACLYISKKKLWVDNDIKFKPILHEDEDIIFQITALSKSSLVLREMYFKRRIRNNSIMTSGRTIKNLNGYLTSLESMYIFKKQYPALYKELKPLWKKRVASLTYTILSLISLLRRPIFRPLLIIALYDSYSLKRVKTTIKIVKRKILDAHQN